MNRSKKCASGDANPDSAKTGTRENSWLSGRWWRHLLGIARPDSPPGGSTTRGTLLPHVKRAPVAASHASPSRTRACASRVHDISRALHTLACTFSFLLPSRLLLIPPSFALVLLCDRDRPTAFRDCEFLFFFFSFFWQHFFRRLPNCLNNLKISRLFLFF